MNEQVDQEALVAALSAGDTATIEEATRMMLRSEDRRFLQPLVDVLAAEDPEGAHVADHAIWVVVEHERLGSSLAAEVLRKVGR